MSRSTILANRDFLLVWSGNAASHIGVQGARMAYPLLALFLTDSPAAASWVSFAIAVPSIVFEMPAGVIADFWDRYSILVLCQRIGLAATLFALAVIVVRPPGITLFLAVAAFLESVAYVFFSCSKLGLIKDVISESERPAAFAFLEAQQPVANMAGRVFGAAAMGLARGLPFLANGASYAFCLWTLSKMSQRGRATRIVTRPPRIWEWSQLSAGLRAIWSDAFLREASVILSVTNAITSTFLILIPVRLHGSGHPAWVIGLVLGAGGLGGTLGAVQAAIVGGRRSPRLVLAVSLWAWAPLFALITISTNPIVTAIGIAGCGFIGVASSVALTLYRLQAFSDEIIGRVFSANKLIAHIGSAVGALLSGALLSTLGPTTIGLLLVGVLIALARRTRHLADPGQPVEVRSPISAPPSAPVAERPTNWIVGLSRTTPNPTGRQHD